MPPPPATAPPEPPAPGALPGRPWWREISRETLRADAAAALLAATLVLPQAIAFASLAGLPPAWGLYGAIVGMAVAALAGSSRHVLTGPTNALSLALAASLAALTGVASGIAAGPEVGLEGGLDGAAAAAEYLRLALVLTLMVGAIQLAIGLLRLGSLAHFISPSVLLGFTSGAAVLIAWSAAKDFVPRGQPDLPALAAGGLTLAVAALLGARGRIALGMLLGLAGGSLLAWWLGAGTADAAAPGAALARVGALPSPWPVFGLPELRWDDLARLAPVALALALVGIGQTVAIAKALAARSGQALDVNRECAGQGLANVAVSCFSGFAGCGSLNRSLPYQAAGARTPLGGVMASLLLLAGGVLAAPALAWISLAAIDGILLLVAWALLDRAAWRELWRVDRREAAVAAGTFAAMLLLPVHVAILAGVAASLIVYLYRTAHPALRRMGFATAPEAKVGTTPPAATPRPFVVLAPGAPECPQLTLLRMEGSVWFGAAAHVADALRALRAPAADGTPAPRHLLVMSKSMNFLDAAGVALWEQERRERAAMGGSLHFHRPRPEVLAAWQRAGFDERLGAGHVHADKRSAIAAIVPRLDGAICARCRHRVFEECARQPGAAG